VISYLTCSSLLSVWDLATDTVMYCFFFDYNRSGSVPTNYPFQLKNILGEIKSLKEQHDKECDEKEQKLLEGNV